MRSLADLEVGDPIWFKEGKSKKFIVRAKKGKFLVANTGNKISEYTIIDTEKEFCGPDDRTFTFINYKDTAGCESALDYLIDGVRVSGLGDHVIKINISQRHGAKASAVLDLEKTLS